MQSDTIEQQVLETYNANLLFLQQNNPALFDKIISLNLAIEKGYHTERYSLEYKEEGYFDVLEIENGKWLYGDDSRKHAELAARSIDFSKEGNLFETFYNVEVSKEKSEAISQLNVTQSNLAGAADLIYYSSVHASKKNTTMKKLYKFIFVGTGLGLHITEIHKKLHSYVYFIIEDDLELFRLSLFVTNYHKICEESTLIFSVFDDDDEFEYALAEFFEEFFYYNHYIKFFNILSHSETKLRSIQHFIAGQNYLIFNYSPMIMTTLRPLEHLQNGYRFLNLNTLNQNEILSDKPALLLGAGPSFQHQIPWLKENHSKFMIIAVTAVLSKLEELGIKPDIITQLDGFDPALIHIAKLKDLSFFNTTIALLSGFTQSRLAGYFKKENVYIIEGSSQYKEEFGRLTSSNIGAFSLALLLKFNIKDIYVLGLDFALDQKSGHTHANTHSYTHTKKLEEVTELGGAVDFNETIIKVKGNFSDEVFTTLLFDDMRRDCNTLIKVFKTEGTHIYNLSNGAYINESIPMQIGEAAIATLSPIGKETLYADLKAACNASSETYLTPSELAALEHRIRYCDALITILDTHLHTPHPTLDQFHYNLLTMFRNLLAEPGDEDTARILLVYFQYVSGYLFDLINTKEIDSTKKMIKHINKAIIPQMKRIVEYVRDTMEEYRKFEAKRKIKEV